MYCFKLPKHQTQLNEYNVKIEYNCSYESISKTLYSYVQHYKKQIGENGQDWDNLKKYTNPYEFIHTPIPNSRSSICKLKPLSRSFFKMIELLTFFNLNSDQKIITSFHLAEGPGGFIEALAYKRKNSNDTYYGMTLLDDNDVNVPSWKKSQNFINKTPNFIIENGESEDGDLFKLENLLYCNKKYSNSIDLITADGGFDFSEDFDNQEQVVGKLLLAEIIFALTIQKEKGNFILKIFDIMNKFTLDLIYILTCFYDEVNICKPLTSRIGNSEKYVVCKGFNSSDNKNNFLEIIKKNYKNLMYENNNISSLLNIKYDLYFINKIQEINAIYGQQQIENISYTIGLTCNKNKLEKLETMKRNNIQKSIQWCEKYNIPHEKIQVNDNIFLQKRNLLN